MPYVNPEIRANWADIVDVFVERMDDIQDGPGLSPGLLNYLITTLCDAYVESAGLSYHAINDVTGVLTNAQAEFYRRVVVPYEDSKCSENGDVYRSAPHLPTTVPTRKPWPVADLPLNRWPREGPSREG